MTHTPLDEWLLLFVVVISSFLYFLQSINQSQLSFHTDTLWLRYNIDIPINLFDFEPFCISMAPTKRTKDKTSKVVTRSKAIKDTLQLESEEEDSDLEFSGDESGRLPRGSTRGNGRLSKVIPRQYLAP